MADTTNRLAGTVYIAVDGQSYPVVGEVLYNPGNVTRETATGADGVHGYIERPMSAYIEFTFRDAGGLTVADFNAMTNVTVTAELANGKTIIGRNMWTVEAQEVDAMEGKGKVRFEGLQGSVTEN